MPPMKTTPTPVDWPARAVIYQVNLRSLAAREPRNAAEAVAERPPEESPLAYLRRQLPRLSKTLLVLLARVDVRVREEHRHRMAAVL